MTATTPDLSERRTLGVLTRERLVALGREFGVSVAHRAKKEDQVGWLVQSGELDIPNLIGALDRGELRAVPKAHALDEE